MKKRKNILFIVSRLPINLLTGDRRRVYHFIEGLTERGHQLDVLGFVPAGKFTVRTNIETICRHCIRVDKESIEFESPSRMKQLNAFCSSFLNGYPFRVWQWHDEAFINEAKKLADEEDYDVIHFSEVVSGLVFDELWKANLNAKFVVDLIDSVAFSIDNSLNSNPALKPFRLIEKRRLKKYEQYLAKKADAAVLISKTDKEYLGVNRISIIPNGVCEQAFKDEERDIDLVFAGNMAAEANIDAIRWFAKRVMPKLAGVNLFIVGVNPPAKVRELENLQIKVTGFVEDITSYYQRAKLFICPMRMGAGQKNKVLEAMINCTPVISTKEGNTGVEAPDSAIVIANSAEAFIEQIELLLKDDEQRKKLAENGYRYVRKNFSWQKSVDLLEQCYEN